MILIFYFCRPFARVAELVDALDSKSCVLGRAGSIPASSTKSLNDSSFGDFSLKSLVMYVVYALSSLTRNYIYIGLTDNLERRIAQHNAGHEKTTKPYLPFIVLYSEVLDTRTEARLREKYWKSGTGKRQLRKLRGSEN